MGNCFVLSRCAAADAATSINGRFASNNRGEFEENDAQKPTCVASIDGRQQHVIYVVQGVFETMTFLRGYLVYELIMQFDSFNV